MKTIKNLLSIPILYWFVLGCMFCSENALAKMYSLTWPTVTSVTYTLDTTTGNFITSASVGVVLSISQMTEAQANQVMCPSTSDCYIGAGFVKTSGEFSSPGFGNAGKMSIKAGATWKDFIEGNAYSSSMGKHTMEELTSPLTIGTGSTALANVQCAGFNLYYGALTTGTVVLPPGWSADSLCRQLPPQNQSCTFSTSSVDFAFGSMSKSSAAGSSLSNDVTMSCTSAMDISLDLNTGDTIPLSNGMTATFTAKGSTLGSTLSMSSGSNSVPLTATLSGTPSESGAFSGSGVLFVEYK